MQTYLRTVYRQLADKETYDQLFERKLCFLSSVGENDKKQICQMPIPDSFSTIFQGDQGASVEALAASQPDEMDWLNEILPDFESPFGTASVSEWTYEGNKAPPSLPMPESGISTDLVPAPAQAQKMQPSFKGPFDPRYSLERCVYASKRLLELSRGDALKVNPFPACSHVLIAFTLLMQALSLSDGLGDGDDDDDDDDENDDEDEIVEKKPKSAATSGVTDYSRELLQSAQGSAALQMEQHGQQDNRVSQPSRQQRLPQLREILEKVKEARDTLTELSKSWDM